MTSSGPVSSPPAWRPADFADDGAWATTLTNAERDEIVAAAKAADWASLGPRSSSWPPTWSSRWAAATRVRCCPGKHYEDWELADPAGKTLEEIRPIRDEIRDRMANLLGKLASR